MNYFSNNKGLTLIELMIAMSIFITLILGASGAYINIVSLRQKIVLTEEFYNETRFLMERIVKEVRRSTIDYEEYYNQNIISAQTGIAQDYGQNYGRYSQTMINPGTLQTGGLDTYGTRCIDENTGNVHSNPNIVPPCPLGYIVDSISVDKNMGVNPYNYFVNGNTPNYSNAVCDGGIHGDCSNSKYHIQNELYLISQNGREKSIFKLISNNIDDDNDGYTDEDVLDGIDNDGDNRIDEDTGREIVGLLKLTGKDLKIKDSSGADGIIDTWLLHEDFDDFVSMTPPVVEITDLKFIISPLEDPRKAFNENDISVQHQPHVTIILNAQISTPYSIGFNGPRPSISLQTSVTSRTLNEIKSF